MSSKNISVYIPAYNESIHIERAVSSALKITPHVYVIDSFSDDDTVEKAKSLGAQVFQYEWTSKSNFAKKLNWILENVPFKTTWVIRLDADEYFLEETISKLEHELSNISLNIKAVSLNRRFVFMGKWIKRGFYPQPSLRITRFGFVKYVDTWLDENINVSKNETLNLSLDFVDESLIGINKWVEKHLHYANLQVIDDVRDSISNKKLAYYANKKLQRYNLYKNLPLFLRPTLYFFYRYLFRFGFLDGARGFVWAFLQAWWYRLLIDIKIFEMNRACGEDVNKKKSYIKENFGVDL
jgi:glycosyltransferase involved in cell wall biosynthesis